MALNSRKLVSPGWYVPGGPADSISSRVLGDRWTKSPELTKSIRAALQERTALPADAPTVTVTIAEKEVQLVDLRGFEFQSAALGEIDLSYCCLDFSDFRGCKFSGTSLQFSTFRYSRLDATSWEHVQATPVSLRGALMRHALVSRSFFMHSDLNAVDLSASEVIDSSFSSSDFRDAAFEGTKFTNVDVSGTAFSDTNYTRSWYSSQDQKSYPQPKWCQSGSPDRPEAGDAVVMVVEDSPTMRIVLKQRLSHEGYKVVLAHDGMEAMQELRRITPNLVLLDIEMPNMDGFELMRELRNMPNTSALPVVMLTALSDSGYRKRAAEAGVTDYFTKTESNDDLMTRIAEILVSRRSHASGW